MHIGSWDDPKRLTGDQFSKMVDTQKSRDTFATALVNRLQQNNFDGLLISWYFPGSRRVFREIYIFFKFKMTNIFVCRMVPRVLM
jgi:GH18 family chitinase